MIIFLYGSDAYRLRQAKQNLIEEYRKKYSSGVNLFYIDLAGSGNLDELRNILKSTSFFNEHKLAVVSGIFAGKAIADELTDTLNVIDLKTVTDTTLLFVGAGSEKDLTLKHRHLFKILAGGGIVKVFEPLAGQKLAQWARSEIELRGCSIDRSALEKLLNLAEGDSWALINEIEKLTAYKKIGVIGLTDIQFVSSVKVKSDIFNLIDAIAAKDISKSTTFLYEELHNGLDPFYILSMITYQFRNMLIIKDLLSRELNSQIISQKAGLHPFVVKKSIASINKFKFDDMRSVYKTLLNVDLNAKAGTVDIKNALYGLVTNKI